MTTQIHSLQSDLIDQLDPTKFAQPQRASSSDNGVNISGLLRQSLAEPLHYPPLVESVFPGDRIAIAVQNGLPAAPTLVADLIEQLLECGLQAEDLLVVLQPTSATEFGISKTDSVAATDPDSRELPTAIMLEIAGRSIAFQIHNGHNDASVAYVAANAAGDPMHVNRSLVEADVILPIGFAIAGDDLRAKQCLYPDFASAAVKVRFTDGDQSETDERAETQMANDVLGSFFAIQVVSGPGGMIEQIFSGVRADATSAAQSATDALWRFDLEQPADVVVATIESTLGPPAWDEFTQAVRVAASVSEDNSPIIIWSELAVLPPRTLRTALLSQFEDDHRRQLPPELQQLGAIMQERPVYLHSRLSPSQVEALGIGAITSVAEIHRIAESRSSGLVLRDAHRCQPVIISIG